MIAVPCFSLWQPFASLVFAAEPFRKAHETRGFSFPPKHQGCIIAIHAAGRPPETRGFPGLHALACDAFGHDYRYSLPRGAIIGTVRLEGCFRVERGEPASDADLCAGDWTPNKGRWAWLLAEPTALAQPLRVAGRQGWFSAELPGLEQSSLGMSPDSQGEAL